MNTRCILAIFISLFFVLPASATIWIVDNTGISDDYFTTVQNAHNYEGVTNGDTIYVHGSADSYGNLSCSKRLTWLGTGYYLSSNDRPQARTLTSNLGSVNFNDGSEGSIIMGFAMSSLTINEHDIVVMRNYFYTTSDVVRIGPNNPSARSIVKQNIIRSNGWSQDHTGLHIFANASHSIIENNIIWSNEGSTPVRFDANSGPTTFAYNSVITATPASDYAIRLYNATYHSNIINGRIWQSNCNSYNNVISGSELNAEENTTEVDMATVFTGSGSADGRWRLADESPAIGVGHDDSDAGAFGGLTPYVLSGVPPIPVFKQVVVPGSASGSQGLMLKATINSRN